MKHLMKYVLLMLLSVGVLFSLAACQNEAAPPDTVTPTTPVTEAPAATDEPAAPVPDGSFSTPDYEVSVVDGVCYLNFTAGNDTESDGGAQDEDYQMSPAVGFIRFSSLAEMKNALVNGELTDEQKGIIRSHFARNANGYILCNVEKLAQPSGLAGMEMKQVYLCGEDYEILLQDGNQVTAIFCWGDAGKRERSYAEWMEAIENNVIDSHETGTLEGIPCETYVSTTHSARVKKVFLTFPETEESGVTHIMMNYVLWSAMSSQKVSDTIPYSVYVFGEKDGIPYDYYVYNFTEAPTVEWLASFSLAPYTDTAETPAV